MRRCYITLVNLLKRKLQAHNAPNLKAHSRSNIKNAWR